jgi:hypothetical protein
MNPLLNAGGQANHRCVDSVKPLSSRFVAYEEAAEWSYPLNLLFHAIWGDWFHIGQKERHCNKLVSNPRKPLAQSRSFGFGGNQDGGSFLKAPRLYFTFNGKVIIQSAARPDHCRIED